MRKILFIVVCCLMSLSASAQFNLGSIYQPVEVENPYGNPILDEMRRVTSGSMNQGSSTYETPRPQRQRAPQYQIIRGYRCINGYWYKINLKVFAKRDNVYIHSYQDRNSKMWVNAFDADARETTKYDGALVHENFDYKARISGFTVYF